MPFVSIISNATDTFALPLLLNKEIDEYIVSILLTNNRNSNWLIVSIVAKYNQSHVYIIATSSTIGLFLIELFKYKINRRLKD